MEITKTGFYKLIEDLSTRNTTTISTIPKGTIIEITQIDHHKVIGPELYDWIWYDLPVIIWEEMNIDKIKWCVERAEGYHLGKITIGNNLILLIDYGEDRISLDEFFNCKSIARSHFLTRTIEGINKEYRRTDSGLWISLNNRTVEVAQDGAEQWEDFYWYEDYDNTDEPKQEAIDYVYNYEKEEAKKK